ncbi:MAG TPA: hypothetical protein PLQ93_10160, partial [Bacteroidia bacterium]|nr:hypothetical protein [Bacteroidia bacterium]
NINLDERTFGPRIGEYYINQTYRNYREIVQNTKLYSSIEQLNNCKQGLLSPSNVRTDVEFNISDTIPAWIIILKPQYGHSNANYIDYVLSENNCFGRCRFGGISWNCDHHNSGRRCKCPSSTE